MIVGDIGAIPTMDGRFCLAQIVKKADPYKKNGLCFVVFFNAALTLEELKDCNFLALHSTNILGGIPVNLQQSKKYPDYFTVIANIPPVNYDVPMFVMGGAPDDQKNLSVISDMSRSYYRYIPTEQIEGMRNHFNVTSNMFEPLVHNWFIDNSHRKDLMEDLKWSPNTIRESDMRINPQEYNKWTGFGSPWKNYDGTLSELEIMYNSYKTDEDVIARHRIGKEISIRNNQLN